MSALQDQPTVVVTMSDQPEPSAPHPEEPPPEYAWDPSEPDDESASLYTADVIKFLVRGKVFSAHRKLLQAKSPVFAAMFKHKMKEGAEKTVEIPDIEVKVFQKLLLYIYKDRVSGLEQYAVPLWIAADKYQIEPLKRICEKHMCPELTQKTVLDGLLFADTNKITKLRSSCIEYLNANPHSVITKHPEKWDHFTATADVPLLRDLYVSLSEANNGLAKDKAEQAVKLENLRNNLPENLNPRLSNTKEFFRILAWVLFGATCTVFAAFLGYVVYIGVTMSVAYTVLLALLVAFVVVRYGIDFYKKLNGPRGCKPSGKWWCC